MVFSSLIFVFVFLVLNLTILLFCGSIRTQNIVMLVSSLIFYAWGGPKLVFLLCGMTLVCWLGALVVERMNGGLRKAALAVTTVIVLGLLGYYKYANFLVANFAAITQLDIAVPNIVLPIGISFYTFQLLSYVVDVYRREVPAQRKYWLLLLYASLFHQCIAGPIVRYKDIFEDITDRSVNMQDISDGIMRFSVGFAKKALLANTCAVLADTFLPAEQAALHGASSLAILCGGIMYMLQIYLDFSAYSDMAIGMGRMVGFHYRENFNYPYMSTSVTEFWRRWHISLGTFFRDYVYIPLGGNRCSVGRHIFNMFVVWGLTGMWHGASWNYILWGLYYFVLLVLEKYVFRFEKNPVLYIRALRHVYLLAVTLLGWYLFRFEDLGMLGTALAGLFCMNGNPLADASTTMTLVNYCFFIIVAIVACTPLASRIGNWLRKGAPSSSSVATVYGTLLTLVPIVLLFFSFISLIGNSYNPFLYSQF